MRAPTPTPLQAHHQAGSPPHHQGGLLQHQHLSLHLFSFRTLPGVQHGSEGDLHVEVDQPAPGEEADPAEVVHQEEARGAELRRIIY